MSRRAWFTAKRRFRVSSEKSSQPGDCVDGHTISQVYNSCSSEGVLIAFPTTARGLDGACKYSFHPFRLWVRLDGENTDVVRRVRWPYGSGVLLATLEEPVAKSYTRQLLIGLEYLHRNGIAHRDIKGANCLVGNDGVIKLADFG